MPRQKFRDVAVAEKSQHLISDYGSERISIYMFMDVGRGEISSIL